LVVDVVGLAVAGAAEVEGGLGTIVADVPDAEGTGVIGRDEPGAPAGGVASGGGGGYFQFNSSSLSDASLPSELFCSVCITS
jgi:hypothetical protein